MRNAFSRQTMTSLSKGRSFALALASVVSTNLIAGTVLKRNLEAGVYPIDTDSVSLPLVEGLMWSALVFVLLSVAILVPKRRWWGVASALFCALAGVLGLLLSFSWLDANHYLIAIGFVAMAAVCVIIGLDALRQRASEWPRHTGTAQITR